MEEAGLLLGIADTTSQSNLNGRLNYLLYVITLNNVTVDTATREAMLTTEGGMIATLYITLCF